MSSIGKLIFSVIIAMGCAMAASACETAYVPAEHLDAGLQSQPGSPDPRLFPKFGNIKKTAQQVAADEKFLADSDSQSGGDRVKAAEIVASRGWDAFRAGDRVTAMYRWNQAWMLDNCNGTALWGFAIDQYERQKPEEAMALLSEAERGVGGDVDFLADKARMLSLEGLRTRDDRLMKDAFAVFAEVNRKAPEHTMNLQNWAIALFYSARYAEAWEKIKLAEATPRKYELDRRFVAELESKMKRP